MSLRDHADLGRRFTAEREFAGGEGRSLLVRDARRPDAGPLLLKLLDARADLGEARLLTSLAHPRIPRVLEVGRSASGAPFLLRAFVAGSSLAETPPGSVQELTHIAGELLEILAYVHLRGVLHLDLKPANVVRDPGGAVHLLDFGLGARGVGVAARGGTPFFAAPEVLLGGVGVDRRADLFGLGALLVALAHGRRVDLAGFRRRFPAEPFLAAAGVDPAALPAGLRALIERAVEREPRRRFADAQEALEALRGGRGGSGRPGVARLELDPVAVHEAWLADLAAAARAAPGRALCLQGGGATSRERLALHLASELGDVTRIESDAARSTLRRGVGSSAAPLSRSLPAPDRATLGAQLAPTLGLDAAAAAAAADWLRQRGGPDLDAVNGLLVDLAAAGRIVPDGVGWAWPDAAAGRLEDAAVAAPIDGASALRAAAAAGRVFAAERAFASLAAARPELERELRAALVEGLLRCGEPARALPLAADLPRPRARALLDLGRAAEAAVALGELVGPAGDSDEIRRMVAMARHLAGRHAEAVAATASFAAPTAVENRICRGSLLAAAGQLEAACDELTAVCDSLDAEREPYLRAFALSNLGDAWRQRGDPGRALELHRAALELYRRVGHVRHVATASSNLGVVAKDLGLYDEARDALRRARGLFAHVGDELGVTLADANLGVAQLAAGDARSALQRFDAALPRLAEIGAEHVRPLLLALRARCRALLGDRNGAAADLSTLGPGPHPERIEAEVARARAALDDPASRPAEPAAAGASTTMIQPPAQPGRSADPDGIPRAVFRTFLAINRRLGRERDLERAMRHLLDAAESIAGARSGYLLVQRGDAVRVEVGTGDAAGARAFSRSLANKAIAEQRTMTAEDALADRSLLEMPSVQDLRVRSAVCVPFRAAAGLNGALYVEHGGRAAAFAPADVELLEALADQAAIAVDRMVREEELAEALARSERDLAVARRAAPRAARTAKMIGDSAPMTELRAQVERFGSSGLPVLVLGETGSGKELVARALHDASERRSGPFVSENCSAIPESLIESELFGHVKGAFTGADRDRPGLFELADGGTLFLDEVGDMPVDMQVKLLRALQEGRVRRVGASETSPVDVRLLTATHRDLPALLHDGRFREDLYYRIAAGVVRVPPLRERGADVVLLAEHFLERLSREHRRTVRLGAAAAERLQAWRWPGNVRELEHVVARGFVLTDGEELDPQHLPQESGTSVAEDTAAWPVLTMEETTRRAIRAALRATDGDKTAAAKVLGISRTALYDRLRRDPELG